MTEERTCYVSRVILSLVSLHEDLSFEPVSKAWSVNKGFLHPSKLYASNLPSIDHRLELDYD